jgi:protoporphyrinogen oxidase
MKATFHAFKTAISRDRNISQKDTETSLIETFLYPKFGPGQMWETVALHIQRMGGEIYLNSKAIKFVLGGDLITEVEIENLNTGQHFVRKGDYFVSTMPVRDLILSMEGNVPNEVERLARGLVYRDFITVGLLLQKLKIKNETKIGTFNKLIPDNWIYIQERDVKLGRLQIFNNWSPYMVNDPNTVWIGLEYFCNEGDSLWNMNDNEFSSFAIDELSKIDVIEKKDVLDYVVIRMPKTYPAYFGTYNKFSLIREFTDKIKNLFLIGRNGMHRYNNMDHSMLAAMEAVENIAREIETKDNIWAVNSEEQYLEDRKNL